MPLIRNEFVLSYAQAGLIGSAFTISSGLGHLIIGWLSYHVKLRILAVVGISGMAMAFFLTGLAPNYVVFLAILIIAGLLSAGYHPAALPLIAQSVERDTQSTAFGLHSVGSGASFFLAPLVAAAISVYWGWRGTFIAMSVPTILYGLFLHYKLGRTQAKKPEESSAINYDIEGFTPPPHHQTVAFISLVLALGSILLPLVTFIPLYLVDHFGISTQSAAALTSAVFFAGLFGGPLGGYLADRLGTIPVLLGACFLTGPAIYLLTVAEQGIPIIAVLVFLGVVNFIRIPLGESYIVNSIPPRHRTMILSTIFFVSLVISGILSPLIGKTIDNFGFYITLTGAAATTFAISTICALIALKK